MRVPKSTPQVGRATKRSTAKRSRATTEPRTAEPSSRLAHDKAPRQRARKPPVEPSARTSAAAPDQAPSSEDTIRVRAYFLWLERGQPGGDPVRDWLDAERALGNGPGSAAN